MTLIYFLSHFRSLIPMAQKKNVCPLFEAMIYVMSVILCMVLLQNINGVNGDPQVPCFFIFGDSLADNGNNNPLQTLAKANYRPYGIDFPGGIPTGRFSNGRTSVDVLGLSTFSL